MAAPSGDSHTAEMVPNRWRYVDPLVEKPLTYPSLTTLTKFLPFSKRRELVRGADALRTLNSKMPFFFHKVVVSYQKCSILVNFDGYSHTFHMPGVVNARTTQTPSARAKLERCFAYYLGHPDTFVENMKISILTWPGLSVNAKIGHLWLNWERLHFCGEMLQTFWHATHINHIRLVALESIGSDWVPAISKITAKKLTLNSRVLEFPHELLEQLPFPVLSVVHRNFDPLLAIRVINKLAYESYDKESLYCVSFPNEEDAFWDFLKTKFEGEIEHENFFSTPVANPEHELLVLRKEYDSNRYLIGVIVDRGTAKGMLIFEHWFYGRQIRFLSTSMNDIETFFTNLVMGFIIAFFVAFFLILLPRSLA